MEYSIHKEQHGFTVRSVNGRGLVPMFWAYSTLDEALAGIKELMLNKTIEEKP